MIDLDRFNELNDLRGHAASVGTATVALRDVDRVAPEHEFRSRVRMPACGLGAVPPNGGPTGMPSMASTPSRIAIAHEWRPPCRCNRISWSILLRSYSKSIGAQDVSHRLEAFASVDERESARWWAS